jgi:hypothetical protein
MPSLPAHIAPLLADNDDMVFPANAPPRFSRWRRPAQITAQLADELDAAAASYRSALGAPPPGRAEVIVLLSRLAAHYWADLDARRWEVLFNDYAEDLAAVPGPLLVEAVANWRRTGTRFPKVAELLTLVAEARDRHSTAIRRMEAIADGCPIVAEV